MATKKAPAIETATAVAPIEMQWCDGSPTCECPDCRPRDEMSECPECGADGPHDDNGARKAANRSFACRVCGAHFDALDW